MMGIKRLLVTLAFTSQAAIVILFTLDALASWEANPLVTSVTFKPIWKAPFPAVTICPLTDGKWSAAIKSMEKQPDARKVILDIPKMYDLTRQLMIGSLKKLLWIQINNVYPVFYGQWFSYRLSEALELQWTLDKFTHLNKLNLLQKKMVLMMHQVLYFDPDLKLITEIMDRMVVLHLEEKSTEEMATTVMQSILCHKTDCTAWNKAFEMSKQMYPQSHSKYAIGLEHFCNYTRINSSSGNQKLDEWCGHILKNNCFYDSDKARPSNYLCLDKTLADEMAIFHLFMFQMPNYINVKSIMEMFINAVHENGWSRYLAWGLSLYDASEKVGLPEISYHQVMDYLNGDFQDKTELDYVKLQKCLDNSTTLSCDTFYRNAHDVIDNDFVQKYLETAIQPLAHHLQNESQGNNYAFLPLCQFISRSSNEDFGPCDQFKLAKLVPLKSNCYTFNGDKSNAKSNEIIGPKGGLKMVVDFSAFLEDSSRQMKPIQIILHEPGSAHDSKLMVNSNIEVAPGLEISVGIRALITESSESCLEMKAEKRQCKSLRDLADEEKNALCQLDLKYSSTNCIMLNNIAIGIQKCGCVPWHLLSYANQSLNICSAMGMNCFRNFVQNTSKDDDLAQLTCFEACDFVKYSISSMTNVAVDAKKDYKQVFKKYFLKDLTPFMTKMNHNFTLDSYLEDRWKKVSIIHLNFDDPQVMNLGKHAKFSFSDKVGNVGGTIGMFLGFSAFGLIDHFINYLFPNL